MLALSANSPEYLVLNALNNLPASDRNLSVADLAKAATISARTTRRAVKKLRLWGYVKTYRTKRGMPYQYELTQANLIYRGGYGSR